MKKIKDFRVEAKNPSLEARQRWRSYVELVKNRPRRFRMIRYLDKLAENVMKRCQIQITFVHRCSTATVFLVVINLLLEIASAVVDQLSSIRKPYFVRISLVMAILSVVLSILDLTYKIRVHEARFRCKRPIPWFYHTKRGYNNRIFGNFTDTVLLFCVAGGLIVSTVNWSFIEKGREGPIKLSVWPLFFAIGMVVSKFLEKPAISKDNSPEQKSMV